MDAKNRISVGDLFRAMPTDACVSLTHGENDNQHYIFRSTTESATVGSIVDFYGWRKLDGWTVKTLAPSYDGENPTIKITYTED